MESNRGTTFQKPRRTTCLFKVVEQMWNRCGTDHLFHYLATATGKDKTGTDGTDDLLKKRTEKEIEGGGVKNCTSTTVCMSFLGITMESFNVPSVPLMGFCLRHSENCGTDTSVPHLFQS